MTQQIEIRGRNIGEDGWRLIMWSRLVWWKYVDVLEAPTASISRLDCNVCTLVSDFRMLQAEDLSRLSNLLCTESCLWLVDCLMIDVLPGVAKGSGIGFLPSATPTSSCVVKWYIVLYIMLDSLWLCVYCAVKKAVRLQTWTGPEGFLGS